MDWYRNLQIMLLVKDKLPYLEQPILAMPVPPAGQVLPRDVLNTHTPWVKASKEITGLMLMTMDPDIQKNLEQLGAYDMLKELKTFMGKTVTELHDMLKLHEQTFPPKDVSPALHAIRAGRVQKNQKKKSHKAAKGNQGKGKAKMGNALVHAPFFAPKPKNPLTPKKDNPAKDAICHQWVNTSWVYDTGYGTQGLRGSRKLKPGALSLYVGDGHRAAVEAIGEFNLCFPSGLVLILHNCHYAPSISRGIISVSCLYKDGFVNHFENDNIISVFRNNLVYFCAIPRDDIYEIDLSSSNTNDSIMCSISNKRAKLNLDSTLLWHCHLGYISKKRIEKLQQDGLLNSTDIEVENQLGKTIKPLRSDHGGKYMSQDFLDHLKEHVIIARRTPPYTPQHNGVSKRRNRTLLDMTPYNVWHGQAPKLYYLKVWGCEALVKRNTLTIPDNLEPKSIKCIFVGYPKETMRYSFYYPPENKLFATRNAEFFENSLITQEASRSLEDLEIIQEEDTHPSIDTSLNLEEDD
nr:hypothetical protein [Tanacetum cinerariifolium]